MNQEKKYKLVFGEEVTKRDFFNLQRDSKLMKPASLNSILGKRDWKLNQQSMVQNEDKLSSNQTEIKKKKLETIDRIFDGKMQTEALPQENSIQSSPNCLENSKKRNRKDNEVDFQVKEQVNLRFNNLDQLPTIETFEGVMAYNLRKKIRIVF